MQKIRRIAQTGVTLTSHGNIDGEGTRGLFVAWPAFAAILSCEGSCADLAVRGVWNVLQRLYKRTQDVALADDCSQAAEQFRYYCAPTSRVFYLYLLHYDVPKVLQHIHPLGLAWFSNDLCETANARHKDFYHNKSNCVQGKTTPIDTKGQEATETTVLKELRALQQTFVHFFLWQHAHIVSHRVPRPATTKHACLFARAPASSLTDPCPIPFRHRGGCSAATVTRPAAGSSAAAADNHPKSGNLLTKAPT